MLSKDLLNDSVVCKRDALLVDLAVAALVDEFTDRLQVGFSEKMSGDRHTIAKKRLSIPVCNIGLNQAQHLLCSLRHLNKNTIVDLEQSEKLENLAWLRRNFIDTE